MVDTQPASRGFDWLLGACIIGALAALLFVLLRGGEYLSIPQFALLLVGAPVVLIVALFALRLWVPSLVPGALLSLIAFVVAILAAEMAFISGDVSVWGNDDLFRDRAAFLAALGPSANPQPNFFPKELVRRSGGEEYRSVLTGTKGELLPLAGVANATVAMCRDGDRVWQPFQADEHGFPNPAGLWQSDEVRVLSVGDSHVQGWCVPPAQSFMGLIAAAHPRTVNLGVGGNGPLANLALLREYGAVLRPKTVLWMFSLATDVSDLDRERRTPILSGYMAAGYTQDLVTRQDEIDRALKGYEALVSSPQGTRSIDWAEVARRVFTLYDVRLRFRVDRGSVQEVDYAFLRRLLEAARKEVEGWGGEMVFVFLPSQMALQDKAVGQTEVRDIVLDLRIPLIDVTPEFRAQPDPPAMFQAREGTHYSLTGHQLVARTILSAIERQ